MNLISQEKSKKIFKYIFRFNSFLSFHNVILDDISLKDLYNFIRFTKNEDGVTIQDMFALFFFDNVQFSVKEISLEEKLEKKQLKINNNNNTFDRNISLDRNEEEKYFIDFISFLIDILNQIEQAKEQVIFRADFILEDLFRIFDKEMKGFITKEDFKDTLKLFEVPINESEINSIYNTFSQDENYMNFKDFSCMIIPYNDKNYQDILFKRTDFSSHDYYISLDKISPCTKYLIQNLFKLLLSSETRIKNQKESFPDNYINIFFNKVFPKISHDKKVLSPDDLYNFLYNSNIIFTQGEFNLICNRLDKGHKMEFFEDDFEYLLK